MNVKNQEIIKKNKKQINNIKKGSNKKRKKTNKQTTKLETYMINPSKKSNLFSKNNIFSIKNKSKILKEEKNILHNNINILEEKEDEEEDNNNSEKQINTIESKGNSSIKDTNSTDKQNNNETENKKNKDKKEKKLLGKKRRLKKYKEHSLSYNELSKLYDEKEIELNINSLYSYTNLNPSKIKGNFIGLLNNNENNGYYDFIIEINNQNDVSYNHFIVYDSKKFNKKLSFLEKSEGNFYLLYNGYAAFFINDSIKIYYFSNNNTSFDIFQRIMLPEELRHTILFPFKFIHDDNFYFFFKMFCLKKDNKITLYKFNKDEQKNENDHAVSGRTFIEDKKLNLDFEFIWFLQKNNNELLFFYEMNFVFKLNCFDLSTNSITQRKTFLLNNIKFVKIAQYADDIINKRFLLLSNHNLLYIIDSATWQITVIKELDIIEFFKIFNDNTLWTIESCEKTITIENNKKRNISYMYLRQYKISPETQEIIKIGERKLSKYYSIINNITQVADKKVLIFTEGKKLVMLN